MIKRSADVSSALEETNRLKTENASAAAPTNAGIAEALTGSSKKTKPGLG